MDKVTRYEWHGSLVVFMLLCLLVITIPFGVVYFLTHLLKIETQIDDATNLSRFLDAKRSTS